MAEFTLPRLVVPVLHMRFVHRSTHDIASEAIPSKHLVQTLGGSNVDVHGIHMHIKKHSAN